MDIFGNTVNLQLETVILFFLIGIVIVLLLFCFEPWKQMTTARASTPASPTQQPTAERPSTTTVEPFQQVTPDARVLYKKVGFSELGKDGKDARVNILRFKTRPIKNSETDFQVAYMFTKDIETLKLLNKGESIKLMDSSTTTTTQPAGTNTSEKSIYNSFTADIMAQSAYPTLKRTLCAQLGLPEDYVDYSMGLADKVLADYMARAGSTADTKLLAAQELVKAEFSKLPASGGTEWQSRLRDGVTKIISAMNSLPLPLDGLLTLYGRIVPNTDTYWSDNNKKAQIRASILYVIESIINTNPLLSKFPTTGTLFKYMYVYDMISAKISDSATKLNTKIKANPTKLLTPGDLEVSQGTFQEELNGIPYIDKVFTPRVSANASDNTITEIGVIGNAIYDTFRVFLYGQFVNTEDITTTTTKPEETPQPSNDEIQVLQAIGSKYYDPATGDRKVRDGDFYLEFGNGLDVNIKFLFNYVTNMTGEVKCEATITELPPGSTADPNYKTYTFDNCLLEYISGKMVVTLEKRTGPLKYAKIASGKYCAVTVIQTFKLEINIDGAISLENDTFQSIIQRAVFFNTFMTYSLSAQLEPGVVKPIYTINLFPQSITSSFESLKEYTKAALGRTTERLLKDNVAEIVTPMFMVDQRLDRTEGILTKIMDHYRFNELSNAQSGYRFYPVSE